jgi:hypothetical protein
MSPVQIPTLSWCLGKSVGKIQSLNVKAGGTYSNHCVLKGYRIMLPVNQLTLNGSKYYRLSLLSKLINEGILMRCFTSLLDKQQVNGQKIVNGC